MSSISAGTAAGTSLVQTGDTTGALVIKTGASAVTAATFNADQTTTLAQPLPVASGGTGATSLSGITVGNATNATSATNATTATNLAGGSAGTVPYQSAAGTTAMLAAGSAGQVLQSNGAAAPSWVTASPSAMTLISTQTASNSASLAWTGLSGYNNYMLIFDGLAPSAGGYFLYVQVGTPSYITSYNANEVYIAGTGAISNFYQSSGSSIVPIGYLLNVRSTSYVSGAIRFYNMTNSLLTNAEGTGLFIDQTNNIFTSSIVSGQVGSSTAAKTAIRILYSTGNIVSGTASLYGITS